MGLYFSGGGNNKQYPRLEEGKFFQEKKKVKKIKYYLEFRAILNRKVIYEQKFGKGERGSQVNVMLAEELHMHSLCYRNMVRVPEEQ